MYACSSKHPYITLKDLGPGSICLSDDTSVITSQPSGSSQSIGNIFVCLFVCSGSGNT